MRGDKEKHHLHCGHSFSFDFIICPHCDKKYNKKY